MIYKTQIESHTNIKAISNSYTNNVDSKKLNNFINSDYRCWSCEDVHKYFSEQLTSLSATELSDLKTSIIREGVDGSLLNMINRNDLHRWGVIKMKDKLLLENQIQNLIRSVSNNKVVNNNTNNINTDKFEYRGMDNDSNYANNSSINDNNPFGIPK